MGRRLRTWEIEPRDVSSLFACAEEPLQHTCEDEEEAEVQLILFVGFLAEHLLGNGGAFCSWIPTLLQGKDKLVEAANKRQAEGNRLVPPTDTFGFEDFTAIACVQAAHTLSHRLSPGGQGEEGRQGACSHRDIHTAIQPRPWVMLSSALVTDVVVILEGFFFRSCFSPQP